ncbi:MAG: serine hydrolase [Planctomycetes bacterium]|nr:serine hydrolase [Planctomycetota bacterium]
MPATAFASILALAALGAALGPHAAQAPDPRPRVDALVAPLLEGEWAVGLSIALLRGADTRFLAYGKLAAGHDRTPDADTLFEIGSVTKVFTALLLADMAERGEVELNEPVRACLPAGLDAPGGEREILLSDLATHTSGLPRMPDNLAPADPADPYADYTPQRLHAYLARRGLGRHDRETYAYSNLGGGLLGHALARRAGRSYEKLVLDRICGPLGMPDTRSELSAEQRARFAAGQDTEGGPVSNWRFSALAGAGALRSTARDMAAFVRANLDPAATKLSAAIEATHEPRAETVVPKGQIALGWHVGPDGNLRWHNGQTAGYHSFVAFDRTRSLGVVVLCNSPTGLVDELGMKLLPLLAGEAVEPLRVPKTAAIEPAVLEGCVGRYQLAPGFVLEVTREGDRLFGQATGQPRLRLYPESPSLFHCRTVDARITFVRDANGRAKSLLLHQNGRNMPGPRLRRRRTACAGGTRGASGRWKMRLSGNQASALSFQIANCKKSNFKFWNRSAVCAFHYGVTEATRREPGS